MTVTELVDADERLGGVSFVGRVAAVSGPSDED